MGGSVAYRELGSGPPLVLITGFSATMDDWSPAFVDALAAHLRVIELDNAGVGETAAVAPLTITAMAAQTSALLTALHIERASVLGWSMGGMVAQALAVGHPDQVGHLVLSATQPGTGKKWIAGDDRDGADIGALRIPTLVADGDEDRLDPLGNDRLLASAIRGAQLVTYRDAGHAFLFQDEAAFVPRLLAFLTANGG